jgi:hypothetical protein
MNTQLLTVLLGKDLKSVVSTFAPWALSPVIMYTQLTGSSEDCLLGLLGLVRLFKTLMIYVICII